MTLYRIEWNHTEPPKPFSEEVRAYREHLGMEFGTLVPVEPDYELMWCFAHNLQEMTNQLSVCRINNNCDVRKAFVVDAALKEGT